MCTYLTEHLAVAGSGKFADGWAPVRSATVYFDHPAHAPVEHSLNIDFFANADATPSAAAGGAGRRIAVELTASTARELAAAIERALASAPAELTT